MLSIPALVKGRFKTDTVRKNLRIHFPNGEYPDITNGNIEKESLRFTESLCSQDVFKFGLAEASVIEFETVGIGNMYGMTIEAGIEVDVSNLTAQQMAVISAGISGGTYVGKIVSKANSDIGYAYYRVPLGTFRVESCPRNHQAMTHRRVTAYTTRIDAGLQLSPFETAKNATEISSPVYEFDALCWIIGNLGFYSSGAFKFTSETLYGWSDMTEQTGTYTTVDTGNGNYCRITYVRRVTPELTPSITAMYGVYLGGLDYADMYEFIKSKCIQYGSAVPPKEYYMARYSYGSLSTPPGLGLPNVFIDEDMPVFYPYIPQAAGSSNRIYLYQSVDIEIYHNGQRVVYAGYNTSGPNPVVYSCAPYGSHSSCTLQAEPTGSRTVGGYYYTFTGAVSLPDVVAGYGELLGLFVKTDRAGSVAWTALDDTSPVEIGPSDYQRGEVWWDEYDVSPIGIVRAVFNQPDEQEIDVSIGDGASVYDLSENAVIQNMQITADDLETLLAGEFATNAASAGFTPVDMVMQGWPWLEAGDALEITAEDGTVVDTYALRIELSGIQNLNARIVSQGGTIIGEV